VVDPDDGQAAHKQTTDRTEKVEIRAMITSTRKQVDKRPEAVNLILWWSGVTLYHQVGTTVYCMLSALVADGKAYVFAPADCSCGDTPEVLATIGVVNDDYSKWTRTATGWTMTSTGWMTTTTG
jgi:hypothetical protein